MATSTGLPETDITIRNILATTTSLTKSFEKIAHELYFLDTKTQQAINSRIVKGTGLNVGFFLLKAQLEFDGYIEELSIPELQSTDNEKEDSNYFETEMEGEPLNLDDVPSNIFVKFGYTKEEFLKDYKSHDPSDPLIYENLSRAIAGVEAKIEQAKAIEIEINSGELI